MGDENASMHLYIALKESFCPSIYVDAINNEFGLKITDYRPTHGPTDRWTDPLIEMPGRI